MIQQPAKRLRDLEAIDVLCDRFEVALTNGEQPFLDDWLARADVAAGDCLSELVSLELYYRIRSGEVVAASDYLTRFPQLSAEPAFSQRLEAAEFYARQYSLTNDVRSDHERQTVPRRDTQPNEIPRREWVTDFLHDLLEPTGQEGELGRLDGYRIREIIGHGGMGVVLLAFDPILERIVAIKVVRPSAMDESETRERFLREARAAAAVDHARVVPIYHVGEWRGTPYLVMPRLAGMSLAARLKLGPIGIAPAVRWAKEIAEGLAAAHAKRLIHRDIKPANLWLEPSTENDTSNPVEHIRILDFGLVRPAMSVGLTEVGGLVGTPNYMSPEQASGAGLDERSDLFGLGCVLYELVTGVKSFSGENIVSILNSLSHCDPVPPQQINPLVPRPLSDFIQKLLAKSPDDRPQSALLAAAELGRLEQSLNEPSSSAEFSAVAPSKPLRSRVATKVAGSGQKSRQQPRLHFGSMWLILPALFLLLGWGLSVVMTRQAGISPVRAPLRVLSIDVVHYATSSQGSLHKGVLGRDSFDPQLGDKVQVRGKLNRAAYSYLIAFRPDGQAELCSPELETDLPLLSDSPQYPFQDRSSAYGLSEGSGLWVFVVVASDSPLPPYADWTGRQIRLSAGGARSSHCPLGVVWWIGGDSTVEVLTAAGMVERGKGEKLDDPVALIQGLTDGLNRISIEGTAAALGFGVAPATLNID